ncbi:hypothetical protein AQUCO_01600153v1 [Aquilegia coerulea]|uniref:C2H2-type domain-containing protein n=1 Tax=Aquilegia coerulea TaxID=218851 RepID=A0A2G5DQB2_AQUCA|nr:hypothetical protein AQUCO_01600153v1 [Aquilegia coerulea]PIA45716.1 hypothetical protein AQUCO_01600153v1 [Aquilegia coerulea]
MDRTLYCCHCTVEGFPDVYQMRKHYRNSHRGLKVVCTVCSNQFRRQEDLEDHAEEYHQKKSERLIVSCIHCPRMFLYKFGLKCHNGVVHDKLQVLCKKCGNVFLDEIDLDHHVKKHHNKFFSHHNSDGSHSDDEEEQAHED